MDGVIELVRRPLLVLDEPGSVVEWMSAREPHKADRITNRLRQISDLATGRRFQRASYNRRQRTLYDNRVPASARKLRPGQQFSGSKRTAPDKRLGTRLRAR